MENPRQTQEENRLEILQNCINNARDGIENEFSRTSNTWLECFGSKVFVVETYLDSPKLKTMLSPEKYQHALERIKSLKEKLYQLKQEYPDKNTPPPDDTKKELLRELDVLR